MSYPHRDVLDALTVARQPLLHGPGHYDRAAAKRDAMAAGANGAENGEVPGAMPGAVPRPPWDPQDVAGLTVP